MVHNIAVSVAVWSLVSLAIRVNGHRPAIVTRRDLMKMEREAKERQREAGGDQKSAEAKSLATKSSEPIVKSVKAKPSELIGKGTSDEIIGSDFQTS